MSYIARSFTFYTESYQIAENKNRKQTQKCALRIDAQIAKSYILLATYM